MPELLKKILSVFAEMFPGRHSTNEVGSSMPVYGPEALSLEYRRNRDAILGGDIPEKYTRLIDLVPGDRVLELGAAEGVLSLLLARTKASVIALEKKDHRHEEAQRLQATWHDQGMDVDRCEMVLGDLTEHLDLLEQVDTLLAVRSIYYLHDDLQEVFEEVGRHVRHVVLCGNQNRAWQYRRAKWSWRRLVGRQFQPNDQRRYNFYASVEGMRQLLEGCSYTIQTVVADGDPVVVGSKLIPGAHTV